MKGIIMKGTIKIGILVLSFLGSFQIQATRIFGYYPNYAHTASYTQIQYGKMTHLYFFSLNPTSPTNGSLWFADPYSWFNMTNFDNVVAAARAANPNIRIIICSGGAPGSDGTINTRFETIGSSAGLRNTFCNNLLNFIKTKDIHGWDLDWEFPNTVSARTAHENLLTTMNNKLDSMGTADCKVYELSIAVGGGYTNTSAYNPTHMDYCNANVINIVDYVNLMTYDAPVGGPDGYTSHQMYNVVTDAVTRWIAAKGWSAMKHKIGVGVGFYNNAGTAFNSGGNNNTWYNQTYWPTGGSGCPGMQAKIDYARTQGLAGIMIWQLLQDNLGAGTVPTRYSLLDCIYQYMSSTWSIWTPPGNPCCPFSNPNLGADQSICGVASITLNSGVATNSPSRTFTWKRDGVTVVNASTTANTYNATSAGTYEITVTEGACTRTDEVIISGTLPVPALGADQNICTTTSYNLSPSNLASFPGGTNWQWAEDVGAGFNNISGATSSSLSNVRKAASYRLTASISGCASTNDIIIITSSLPTPLDGCAAAAPIPLSITNPGLGAGPYTWYNVASGGSSLATGTSYNAPAAGTYYVQSGAAGASGYVGGNTAFGAPDWSGTITNKKMEFTTSVANVNIASVDIYVHDWAQVSNIQVAIETSASVLVGTSTPAVSYDNSGSGTPYRLTIPLNITLTTAGTYRMFFTGTSAGTPRLTTAGYPYTEVTGTITLTGTSPHSNKYFSNIQFSAGSPCGRLPVIATVNGSCSVAPVTLVGFTAELIGAEVWLRWATTQEINNDYFEVQRSLDGLNFTGVDQVQGAGNTSGVLTNYLASDRPGQSGRIYYRLAQYDLNGSVNYSSIVTLWLEATEIFIQPNPSSAPQDIRLVGTSPELLEISLSDLSGKLIYQLEGYEINTALKLPGLQAGVYLVTIKGKNTQKVLRMVRD